MSSRPKLDSASLRAASHIRSASANCPLPYDSAPAAMYFSHSESWARSGVDVARARQLPVPDASGPRLGDVEPAPVGREADAVRGVEREDHLADARAVGPRVEDAGAVAVPLACLAVVGEPEAARGVE